ncbi:MAG: hypothetical protein WCL00_05205 [Bacteroidota bacterium]
MGNFNTETIKRELLDKMETVHEQLEMLVKYEGKIPRIEVDIVMENVRELYENLMKLTIIDDRGKTPPVAAKPQSSPEIIVVQDENAKLSKPEEASETSPVVPHNKVIKEVTIGREPPPSWKNDLKNMITINDKFLLINGLFERNLKDYTKTIEFLNTMNDRKSAFEALEELLIKNGWDENSESFIKLKSIIEKRFIRKPL